MLVNTNGSISYVTSIMLAQSQVVDREDSAQLYLDWHLILLFTSTWKCSNLRNLEYCYSESQELTSQGSSASSSIDSLQFIQLEIAHTFIV